MAQGALVSELTSGSPFAPGNFPARNRVIAGLSDCCIVVESATKGGSLITADIANSYDREVMAFPPTRQLAITSLIYALIQVSFLTFLVSMLKIEHHYTLALAASLLAASQAASVVARIGWGLSLIHISEPTRPY